MTNAEPPPAWLVERARETASELRARGEAVTAKTIADAMTSTAPELFEVRLPWAFGVAAAEAVRDDGRQLGPGRPTVRSTRSDRRET